MTSLPKNKWLKSRRKTMICKRMNVNYLKKARKRNVVKTDTHRIFSKEPTLQGISRRNWSVSLSRNLRSFSHKARGTQTPTFSLIWFVNLDFLLQLEIPDSALIVQTPSQSFMKLSEKALTTALSNILPSDISASITNMLIASAFVKLPKVWNEKKETSTQNIVCLVLKV